MGETDSVYFLSLQIINRNIPLCDIFINIFKVLGIENVSLRYKIENSLLLAFLW